MFKKPNEGESAASDGGELTISDTPHETMERGEDATADALRSAIRKGTGAAHQSANAAGRAASAAAQATREAANKAAGAAGRTATAAAMATATGAKNVWRFLIVTTQWVFWIGLAVVITALLAHANGEMAIMNPPTEQFWIGAGLLGFLVLVHFPPLFFRLPKGWKRWPYILAVPLALGGLFWLNAVSQAFDRSPEGVRAAQAAAAHPAAKAAVAAEGRPDSTSASTAGVASVLPTQAELKTICAKMQNMSTGQPENSINVVVLNASTATLSYVRDDGKFFKYDCRVSGDRVEHRMHDEAGPGTMGRWRQSLWHTWSRDGGEIVLSEHTSY